MNNDCMVTTYDNPYDYFTQFKDWFLYDMEKGYGTCGYLARITRLAEGMSEDEKNEEVERRIDEIIRLDFTGMYKKVYRNQPAVA